MTSRRHFLQLLGLGVIAVPVAMALKPQAKKKPYTASAWVAQKGYLAERVSHTTWLNSDDVGTFGLWQRRPDTLRLKGDEAAPFHFSSRGTRSGRFSCAEPNLMHITMEDANQMRVTSGGQSVCFSRDEPRKK